MRNQRTLIAEAVFLPPTLPNLHRRVPTASSGAPRRGTGEAVGIGQLEKQPGTLTHRSSHRRSPAGQSLGGWLGGSHRPRRSSSPRSPDRQGQGWRRNLLRARCEARGLRFNCPPAPVTGDFAPHNCLPGTPQKYGVFPFLPLFKVLRTFTDHFLSYLKIPVISH